MSTIKVAITVEQNLLAQLDRLVEQQVFPSRSRAIQEAIQDKLAHLNRSRLTRKCAKLDPVYEQAHAEEGFEAELATWPPY